MLKAPPKQRLPLGMSSSYVHEACNITKRVMGKVIIVPPALSMISQFE